MKRKFTTTIMLAAVLAAASAMQRTLVPQTRDVEFLEVDSAAVADSLGGVDAPPLLPQFEENAVSLRGFNKRVSDIEETFFVQNNTQWHLSGITVMLRYIDVNGGLLHERTVHVPCDLLPGRSRQVSINSFDRQRLFYYYLSGKPRKSATPFKVSARLMGYDIAITRPSE